MRSAIATASPPSAQAETEAAPGSTAVAEAVASNLFKLMAIKDEYEVARLYTDGSFQGSSRSSSRPMTGWNSISRRRSSAGAAPTASRANRASGRG